MAPTGPACCVGALASHHGCKTDLRRRFDAIVPASSARFATSPLSSIRKSIRSEVSSMCHCARIEPARARSPVRVPWPADYGSSEARPV